MIVATIKRAGAIGGSFSVRFNDMTVRAAKAATVDLGKRAFGNLAGATLKVFDGETLTERYHWNAAIGKADTWKRHDLDAPARSPCRRCGGQGIDSALDAHCYLCGRNSRRQARYETWKASK